MRRIVDSSSFARSERLCALLTYICDLALSGRESEINEQKIGQEVFRRPPDYDSSADGIVRSQASRLRQRLELYFQQEGVAEPIRVLIPRGGYVPIFEVKESSAASPVEAPPAEPVPEVVPVGQVQAEGGRSGDSLRQWFQWGLSFVLALMLAGLWVHDRNTPPVAAAAPATHPFWSLLFRKNQSTIVVAPDSGLVLYHNASGQDIDLKEYLDAEYRTGAKGPYQIGPSTPRKDWLLDLANRRYTSIVDLKTILHLKDRALALGSEISVHYARDLRPDDFKTGDVILLGSREADPWDELFHHNINFVLENDYKGVFSVLNRNPQKDEPARWVSVLSDPQRRVYGLVAYLPNLSGDNNALLLEGTGMSGTQAAMDFVCDDATLLPFLNRIRRADGTLPHFELLLETHNMGASAVQSQILAWRTMK